MCLPVPIMIGAALMAAGGGMKYFGEKKADKAQSRAWNRERSRQKQFDAEQQGRFEDSLESTRSLTSSDDIAAAVAARASKYDAATKSAAGPEGGYLPGASSAPSVVATAAQEAGAKADANTASLGQALATLGGFGDQLQGVNIDIGRNSQTIDQIASFKRGSLDALQPELNAAKLKGGTLRTLGGLAQTIGRMVMTSGAGGAAGGMQGAWQGVDFGAMPTAGPMGL